MAQTEEYEVEGFLASKFWRVFMILAVALLIFVGPTYVPYLLSSVIGLNYVASVIIGLALLIAGITIMVLLIKKKVIT
jgi:hypothetical protein